MGAFLSGLQLIHSSVVDTAIVFPHRLGLPYKRALKNLMADHLKRIIQDNGENDVIDFFVILHKNGAPQTPVFLSSI